ncbi:MAG TPA: glycosyltransferase, partial [Lachnospiraceae bacterium]|nr:glycosyltransferase [Lachnospiraceae bacterium]
VYPYKGGISHYTGLLYRTLSEKYNTEMISYKMQYPKLLFKREQKDFSNDTFRVDDAKFLLNTANPFNILSVGRRIRKERPALVIMEWWHPYFAPCYYILSKMLKGIKLLFICHNVFPHERFPLDKKLTRLVLKQGSCFILHSGTEADDLLTIKGDAEYSVQVHPTYAAFQFRKMGKEEARKQLCVSEERQLLLFFGYVREYKGLKHLIDAMGILAGEGGGKQLPELYIVGDFDGNRESCMEQIQACGVENLVTIVDGYVPDREVEKYFAASDLVVLPYESATQSGIVQIAYGFHKPVIVTNVGGLPEVVEDDRTGMIVEPCDARQLADAISRFFEEHKAEEYEKNIRENEYRFSWERMREAIEGFL